MSDGVFRLRACTPDDAAALALVGQATLIEGKSVVEHCLQAHASACYAAWLGDARCRAWLVDAAPGAAPVGYAMVAPASLPVVPEYDDDLELKRIYLLGRFQGHGLGRRLLDAALAHARAAGARRLLLGAFAGNAGAIGFYEAAGFTRIGARRFEVGGQHYDDHIFAHQLGAAA